MSKEIIINAQLMEEVRIAIVEEGKLVDLDIETQSRSKHKGNIYKGFISNVEDSLDAAFVEFGEEKQGFLSLSEIRPELYPPELMGRKHVKVSQIFQRGQELIVQVTKDEIGTKGAAVSTYLSIPGRYVVLMHSDDSGGGISRKIESEEARAAARDMLSRLQVPEGMAVIIRTAGVDAKKQDLFGDFKYLCQIWEQINKGAELGRAPTLLYREPDIVIRTIRDYFSNDVSRVVIDDAGEYEEVRQYFATYMLDLVARLELHAKKEPIFQHYKIEDAIKELYQREVQLPSGGSVIIEQTEALVAIDVNSARATKEEGHASTVYKTNLEATFEIARQLRLRDLGGIVIIDFIDMVSSKHKRDIERHLYQEMKNDKARVKIGSISENGTLELTRQRLRQAHQLISHVQCVQCQGTGRVRDAAGLALSALRQIAGYLAKRRVALALLAVHLPVRVANVLSNDNRRELVQLSEEHHLDIHIMGEAGLSDVDIEFEEKRRGQAGLDAAAHTYDLWHESGALKGRSRKNDSSQGKLSSLPPHTRVLSIGPVPTIIEADEIQMLPELEEPQFEDPILEALFGGVKNRTDPLKMGEKRDV